MSSKTDKKPEKTSYKEESEGQMGFFLEGDV